MVEPRLRSRSLKRMQVVTPGHRVVLHYHRKTPKAAKCGTCKATLKGMQRVRSYQLRRLPQSMKSVARPYGGNLCSSCTRSLLKHKARQLSF